MTPAGFLFVAAALLLAVALREWAESRRQSSGRESRRHGSRAGAAVPRWMSAVPALDRQASLNRLARAGAGEALGLRGLVIGRLLSAAVGAVLGLFLGPLLPGRGAVLGFAAATMIGLAAPDLLLERRADRRRKVIVAELAAAIDVLSVGVAGGHSVRALLVGLAAGGEGPLAKELAITVAELEAGVSTVRALSNLRSRISAVEIAQLTLAIERSARLGSPLAAELDRQATSLREAQQREIAERAARASPKIQLVIALVLVPSVLLLIGAALAANSDRFFGAL